MVGILSVALIASLDPAAQMQKARDSARKSDLGQIQKALEVYYNDYGRYPSSFENKIMSEGNETPARWGTSDWQSYMGTLPKDPSSPQRSYAYSSATGESYYLYASLERGEKDAQTCRDENETYVECPNAPADGCGEGIMCNYGVSSSNVSL